MINFIFNLAYAKADGIATGYGLGDGGVRVRVTVRARIFFFPLVPTRSGVHPASHPMGTAGPFTGDKAAGA
jgi:hypothetical protein